MSPSDKFVTTDKDNVFTAFKWDRVDRMMFYNRQQLTFEREENWGLRTLLSCKYYFDDMLDSTGLDHCKLCTYCWNGQE